MLINMNVTTKSKVEVALGLLFSWNRKYKCLILTVFINRQSVTNPSSAFAFA